MPKPPIVLNRVDPTYKATQLHFSDLLQRYGSPIVVLDLVKQSEKRQREVIVGNEVSQAIDSNIPLFFFSSFFLFLVYVKLACF